MNFSRRQFLLWSGGVGSCIAVVAHKANNFSSPAANTSAQIKSQSVNQANPAPTGVFAPPRGDVRIVVISDLNSQYGATSYEPEVDKAIALIPDWQPNLVLCSGDMVAGQSPALTKAEIQAMWAAFDQHIAAPLRQQQLPFGFTIGNHDASAAVGSKGKFLYQQERDLAAAYWHQPQHDPGLQFVDRAKFPFYYSFQQDDVFFLVWDASTAKIPPAQLAWAEQSLASSNAQAAKLRIAIGHLPLYAVAVGRDAAGEVLEQAEQLQSLLERHQVHTYISGHHHAYFPGHQGQLELLHAGALGGGPRPLLNSTLRPQKTLTVVDVGLNSQSTTYTTYALPSLEVVDQRQLPRIIVGPNGRVLRRDIKWADLTPQERSRRHVPSF